LILTKNNDKNPFLKKKIFDQKIEFLAHSEIFDLAQKFGKFESKLHKNPSIYSEIVKNSHYGPISI
jgi:hypothetical protein